MKGTAPRWPSAWRRLGAGVAVLATVLALAPHAAAQGRPRAEDDAFRTPEDTQLVLPADSLLQNDRSDGGLIFIVAVTQPDRGRVTLGLTGTVRYTPDPDVFGEDEFTYTISDLRGRTDEATVTVTVTPVNDPPVARADATATPEDTPVTIDVLSNDDDVDGDPLRIARVSDPARGTAAIVGARVRYTPDADAFGEDAFTYTIEDEKGAEATATVAVNVLPVDDPPRPQDDAAATDEDTPVDVAVLTNDVDPEGGELELVRVGDPTAGTATVATGGVVRYVPAPDASGTATFEYTVADPGGAEASATVTVTVAPVNDAPVALPDAYATDEDTPLRVPPPGLLANDTDVEGTPLRAALAEGVANGSLTLDADGSFVYTPTPDYAGPDAFRYRATDGEAASDLVTVTLTVRPVNDAPRPVDDAVETPEDTPVVLLVLANDADPDGDVLGVASVTSPVRGTATIRPDGRSVLYTPAPDAFGTDAFSYTASDGNGGSATAAVSVTITPVNDPPVARDDAASTPEDTPVTVDVLANDSDVEGDALTLAGVSVPERGTAAVVGGRVRYTPEADYSGPDAFTYTVSDGNGGEATATVSVEVGATNDVPVARNDAVTIPEDGRAEIAVLANDVDADGDALTVATVSAPARGTATTDGAVVTYVPEPNVNGADAFTYTVSDGNGATATASVSVTITPVNDVPVARDDGAQTSAGAPVVVAVLANDVDADGDALTVAAVSAPARGTATTDGTVVTYTPPDDFAGTATFTYAVSDGNGGGATATVTVAVAAEPVTIAVDLQGDPEAGAPALVTATVDGLDVATAEVRYRRGGGGAYASAPLARTGAAYTGTVPASAVTLRGLDYYVAVSDGTTTFTAPDSAPETRPYHVRVAVPEATAPVVFAADGYRMVAVPLRLADPRPAAVFVDDLGPYDPLDWRLFRWRADLGAYAEYPSLGASVEPGVGVWLAARAGATFDVEGGRSVDASGPVTLTLPPGWNQIASPFAFPVAWSAIEGAASLSRPAAWDGDEFALAQTVLRPWEGYFVENATGAPVEIRVPPVEAAGGAAGARAAAAGSRLPPAEGYRLLVRATAGPFRDTDNVLGLDADALPGRGPEDLAEPPPPGDHVRFSAVDGGVRLGHSFQPDAGEGAAWDAEVAVSDGLLRSGPLRVDLALSDGTTLPPGYSRYVLDLDRGVALPDGPDVALTLTPSEPVRRLRVVVGTRAFAEAAAQGLSLDAPAFGLDPPAPNPFGASTTLTYRIPAPGPATLDVVDALGRRVAVLADGPHDAGRYTTTWEGSGVAAGVYVVRLLTADRSVTRTLARAR